MQERRDYFWFGLVVIVAWLAAWPVLWDPRVCILDCPTFFEAAAGVVWWDPRTYVWKAHPARSAYGMMLYLFPIYLVPSVAVRFWVHTGALLAITHGLIYRLVRNVTGRTWVGVAAAILSLCHISFVENYYTMFKGEPWIAAGVMLVSYVLWRIRPGQALHRIAYLSCALLGSLAIYSIKETGLAFLPVYFSALLLLAWGRGIALREQFRATVFLTVCQILGALVQMWLYLHLPATFGLGSPESFVLSPENIVHGVQRLAGYFWMTGPYILVAGLLTGLLWWAGRHRLDGVAREQIAWVTYFGVLCLSMIAIHVPWTAVSPRYYLVAVVAGIVWSVLACDTSWKLASCMGVWARGGVRFAVVITYLLLSTHAIFSVLVNHVSEGRVQQRFDAAYDEMFRFVASHASLSAQVAFIQSPRQIEARQGLPILLRLLYERGDIQCVFPTSEQEYAHAEFICVPYRIGPLNYFRLPASEDEGWRFILHASTNATLEEFHRLSYTSTVWYVTSQFGRPQYESWLGFPAFWALKKGTYEFGWRFYEPVKGSRGVGSRPFAQDRTARKSIVRNPHFEEGMAGWSYWGGAAVDTSLVCLVEAREGTCVQHAVRISTPPGKLAGIAQTVRLRSGEVYRLSATVRSLVTNASAVGFGARVAVFLPPQPERQLVWMSEYNNWWRRELVFTNMIDGTATVYAHMGFGGIASTGDFTDILLERSE
ncbi:MAG: hypothetical protein N2595_02810 [bacterium]|nr:hypothetical protein [bacterium]